MSSGDFDDENRVDFQIPYLHNIKCPHVFICFTIIAFLSLTKLPHQDLSLSFVFFCFHKCSWVLKSHIIWMLTRLHCNMTLIVIWSYSMPYSISSPLKSLLLGWGGCQMVHIFQAFWILPFQWWKMLFFHVCVLGGAGAQGANLCTLTFVSIWLSRCRN